MPEVTVTLPGRSLVVASKVLAAIDGGESFPAGESIPQEDIHTAAHDLEAAVEAAADSLHPWRITGSPAQADAPRGFLSDTFDSPGVDVAMARAFVGQAHASLEKAIDRAVFIAREEVGRLHDVGREALDGDSNDAEHDALYEVTDALRQVLGLEDEA